MIDFSFCDDLEISTRIRPSVNKMFLEKEEVLREQEFRSSSLPLCSVLSLYNMVVPQEQNFFADYYTSIGTAIHESFQKWHIKTLTAFGNWTCSCGKKFEETTFPTCCGNIKYVEIELKYRGLSGHIDMCYKDGKKICIQDYKSTSLISLQKMRQTKQISLKYRIQVLVYTHIMEKKGHIMGLPSLIFVARDDPKSFLQIEIDWDAGISKKVGEFIEEQRLSFLAAKKSFKTRDLQYALEYRTCETEKDYSEFKKCLYKDCILSSVCGPKVFKYAACEKKLKYLLDW